MRQGSSCLTWDPARCSNFARSRSANDSLDPKVAPQNTGPPSKQRGVLRPNARQWTAWTGSGKCLGAGSNSSTDAVSTQSQNDFVDSVSANRARAAFGPRDGTFSYDSSDAASASFANSSDHMKTLPSRPKLASGSQQFKQDINSVEENRQRCAKQPSAETVNHSGLSIGRPNPSIEVNVARSRCHPRRRACHDSVAAPPPKLRRDTDCTDAIVRLIVFFSTKLVHTIWSQASATPKTSKDFNGTGVLPLQVFIQETLRRSKTSYSTLQVALFYLILLRPHVKPCQSGQQQNASNCRALQCGRRMFLTALILASKYLQDRNYSARAWSKISGLPVAEINENERHYLELIKYNLHVSKETFENWSKVVLSTCKASGQGPLNTRPDSPPSSPDGLSCSLESEKPGSPNWWLHHLTRLTPDVIKSTKATEEYLASLSMSTPLVQSNISLDTPPSSPETFDEFLSGQSQSALLQSNTTGQTPVHNDGSLLSQSPTPVGSVPSRPLPPNLPTPQTTPRYDSAFTFSRRPSHADLRCRASLQALVGLDRQAFNAANLETCPPPKPRNCGVVNSSVCHPLKEHTESSAVSMTSSPESSYSDCSSATRSRSSSISSVSSGWSIAAQGLRSTDNKQNSVLHLDGQATCLSAQTQSRANIGSYSFYHTVNGGYPGSGEIKSNAQPAYGSNDPPTHTSARDGLGSCALGSNSDDLNEGQITRLLASLSSEGESEVQERADPAVVSKPTGARPAKLDIGPAKKHKRNRSSKEEHVLHDEVRQFLWNEQLQVCVKDDKKSTTYVETTDKQAQYPLQQWAHAKKPVPNSFHNKRIALQHPPSPTQGNAADLAAEFLRQSVAVM